METKFTDGELNPDTLRRAIEEHFDRRTSEEVVARAEQLIRKPTVSWQSKQNPSRMAAEASWLLMVCHDRESTVEAIVFALNVCSELTTFLELVADSLEQQDTPAMITIHSKRMLLSHPTKVAENLNAVVESGKFKQIERNLSEWASSAQLPQKQHLVDVSETFARIAPLLAESAI